jgi:hypothetical protein
MNLESRAKNRKAEEEVRARAVKASECGEHGGEVKRHFSVPSPSRFPSHITTGVKSSRSSAYYSGLLDRLMCSLLDVYMHTITIAHVSSPHSY